MIRTLLRLRLSVLSVLLLAACTAPSNGTPAPAPGDGAANGDGPSKRVFGTLEYYGEPFQATVSATAEVGRPFAVTVITYGGSCLERGETAVETESLRAEIRPYDYDTTPVSGLCAGDLQLHDHTATVTFAEMGEAEVVFYGLKEDGTGAVNVSYTRTLTVR